jgi:hypothetical protein
MRLYQTTAAELPADSDKKNPELEISVTRKGQDTNRTKHRFTIRKTGLTVGYEEQPLSGDRQSAFTLVAYVRLL